MADVVPLEADPLADIRNTTRIKAVVCNGKLLTRERLDSILVIVEQTARRSWEPHGHPPVQVALWDAVIVGDVPGALAAIEACTFLNCRPGRAGIAPATSALSRCQTAARKR